MDFYMAVIRVFIALPLVILLMFFFFRFLQGRMKAAWGGGEKIKVLERVPLGGKSFLFVVKVGEDYLLLSGNGSEVTLLKELPPELFVEEARGEEKEKEVLSFHEIFNNIKNQGVRKVVPWPRHSAKKRRAAPLTGCGEGLDNNTNEKA